MDNSTAKYLFETVTGTDLETIANDAISAFHKIKKSDENNYFKLRKYEHSIQYRKLPPAGYSLLDIGYGLSIAYKRVAV